MRDRLYKETMTVTDSSLSGRKLWHLFSAEEFFKLETFLDGGLWCSDVGSIIGFDGDAEGTGFHGTFVSCWHVNVDFPSENVWKIFGGDGNGFAIRTSPDKLLALANATRRERLTASCGEVSYLAPEVALVDPAFQVRKSHIDEEEFRFVLKVHDGRQINEAVLKDNARTLAPVHCAGRAYDRPIRQLTFSERDREDYAFIVPIDADALFEELLVGPNVAPHDREKATNKLREAGVHCEVSNLLKAKNH